MLVQRRLSLRMIFGFARVVTLVSMSWAAVVFALYTYLDVTVLRIPFLPIATIGTAVAFYVGFKNNSAYERFWEGRKIWGGIVNESRQWATAVLAYVDRKESPERALATRRELIYRQLAWINALRLQLRKTTRFDDSPHPKTRQRLERDAAHMRNDWHTEISPFVDAAELQALSTRVNPATHLLSHQAEQLATLHDDKRLDLFHQIDLMQVVRSLYALQGKCERIKNTPFPRMYAEYSRWFTRVFLVLVPLGLLDVFASAAQPSGSELLTVALPMCVSAALVSWVFYTMEGVGDASEDPFERSMNDVPMNALCRTIERDLRQLLGEDTIPDPEAPAEMVLY